MTAALKKVGGALLSLIIVLGVIYGAVSCIMASVRNQQLKKAAEARQVRANFPLRAGTELWRDDKLGYALVIRLAQPVSNPGQLQAVAIWKFVEVKGRRTSPVTYADGAYFTSGLSREGVPFTLVFFYNQFAASGHYKKWPWSIDYNRAPSSIFWVDKP